MPRNVTVSPGLYSPLSEKIKAVIWESGALIGLLVAFALASWVGKASEGTDRMKEISGYIREGAFAFLKREYKTMVIVIVALFILIGFAINWTSAVLYVCGALLSVLAGFFGMNVATKGNVRTANAAMESGMPRALKIAFRSGAVMGLCVAGLGLLGLGVDQYQIGVETAKVVAKVLKGADTKDMPIVLANEGVIYLNEAKAKQLGIEIPKEIKDKAKVVDKK